MLISINMGLRLVFHNVFVVEWNSFEHDFIEESVVDSKQLSPNLLPEGLPKVENQHTVWNAKVGLLRNLLLEIDS